MINAIELYADAGRKAAIARNHGDESRARFETDHFKRMRALESDSGKAAATVAFTTAYSKARRFK